MADRAQLSRGLILLASAFLGVTVAEARNIADDGGSSGGGSYTPPPPISIPQPIPAGAFASQYGQAASVVDGGGLGSLTIESGGAYAHTEVSFTGAPYLYAETANAGASPSVANAVFGYDLLLTAPNVATASAIQSLLGVLGGIATAKGVYDVEGSGDALISASVNGSADGNASSGPYVLDIACCGEGSYSLPLQFTQTGALTFTGHFVAVATIVAGPNTDYGSGSVFLDPEIILSPDLLLANVDLQLADGTIPNASYSLAGDVPEPATWATMILGFGLMGAVMGRRRALWQR